MKKIINLKRKFELKFSSPSKRAELIKETTDLKIGENCEIYNNVSFGSEPYLIEIGNNVRITKGVNFVTHDGGIWVLRNNGKVKNGDIFGKIKIGSNVHIGINTVIMPGVTIGNNVIIGVGAVITKDIPDNSVVVGVPGKVIKTIDDYFDKNKNNINYTKSMTQDEKKKYLIDKYNTDI